MPETVLITGASSGIGRAAALAFAQQGSQLFLAARRRKRLDAVAEECRHKGAPRCRVGIHDLASPGEGATVVQRCLESLGSLDVLVCNAGYGIFGPVAETSPESMRRIWQVNFQAAFESIHEALPYFLERDRGHIILTSSIVGKKALAYAGAYSATKFAQVGLGEALWGELYHTGVGVSLICPGFTTTEFQAVAELTAGTPGFQRRTRGQPPEVVARSMVEAVRRRRREVHLTLPGKLLLLLDRLSPSLATRVMAYLGRHEREPRA